MAAYGIPATSWCSDAHYLHVTGYRFPTSSGDNDAKWLMPLMSFSLDGISIHHIAMHTAAIQSYTCTLYCSLYM